MCVKFEVKMNEKSKEYLNKVIPFFPKAFITHNNELVLEPKNNIYFLLDNVKSFEIPDLTIDLYSLLYKFKKAKDSE